MPIHRYTNCLLIAAVLHPMFLGGATDRALIIHRHDSYGLHSHLVPADFAAVAGRSARFGHTESSRRGNTLEQTVECVTMLIPEVILAQGHDDSEVLRDSPVVLFGVVGLACDSGESARTALAILAARRVDFNVTSDWSMDILPSDLPLLI